MDTISVADAYALVDGIAPGAWVAISMRDNTILASGPNAQAVMLEANEKGELQPLIMRVPEQASAMFF